MLCTSMSLDSNIDNYIYLVHNKIGMNKTVMYEEEMQQEQTDYEVFEAMNIMNELRKEGVLD